MKPTTFEEIVDVVKLTFEAYKIEKGKVLSDMMKQFRTVIIAQSTYIFITAAWPILDIESFMAVTGYKTDIWLVKTVGALLIPIAACLSMYLFIRSDIRPAIVLGTLTSISFLTIDFYYALSDVISDVYMVDGIVQLFFLAAWISFAAKRVLKA